MYQILIVDDEEMVIKSLRASIDWENYGFQIVDTATSAKEALEKIERKKPDVVFTDVRMPEIGGLELLSMIKAANPDVLCMVISGYAEFAYVQKALRYEAVGYCLKPFDYDEITTYLKRIREKLDKRKMERDLSVNFLELVESVRPGAKIQLQELLWDNSIEFSGKEMIVVYVHGMKMASENISLLRAQSGIDKQVYLIHKDTETAFLDIMLGSVAAEEFENLHIGISEPIERVSDLKKRINAARKKAYQFFCQPTVGTVVRKNIKNQMFNIVQVQLSISEDTEKRKRQLAELRKGFLNGTLNIDAAILLRNLIETWLEAPTEKEDIGFSWDYDLLCEEYRSAGIMVDQFEEQLRGTDDDDNTARITNQTFRGIYEYVEEHFQKRLTATDISQRFHINTCYVSHLFKKELGKTFTEYLTSKRIQFACEMLKSTKKSISDIAEESGFSDYFYFSRVFHKVMDCTPSEYRSNG